MGAILSVINREGNTEKIQGNANISIISSKGLIEGPLPQFKGIKGSWMLAGRRTYLDKLFNLFIPDGSDFKFPYYFYDYQAKYNSNAKTKHIIPVKIKKNLLNEVLSIAFKARKSIGCKGVTRSDFKFYKNKFYLLEINTQPGMTSLSLVPEIANYVGITFPNLIEKILLDASINR